MTAKNEPLTIEEIEELRKQCHSRDLKHGGRGIAKVLVPTRAILALLSMLPAAAPALHAARRRAPRGEGGGEVPDAF